MGRPLKFKTPEEMEAKAQEYFAERIALDEPILVSGLAYHLDTTRETLCCYEEKDLFTDTIKKIKLRCQMYAEERMYKGNPTGPIFALKNFGWTDKQEIESNVHLTVDPIKNLLEQVEGTVLKPGDKE